ncbi:MAG: YcgL domain-containing protein [Gammaproteobacteria bacterium]|nr:YcgL domain-containing protein [Gammaproteobacteria bacterium]
MHCFVYKGEKKADYYVYLAEELNLDRPQALIPKAILTLLGDLQFVLDFELTEDRKLSQADAKQVINDIKEQGFYLQMPTKDLSAEEDRLFS